MSLVSHTGKAGICQYNKERGLIGLLGYDEQTKQNNLRDKSNISCWTFVDVTVISVFNHITFDLIFYASLGQATMVTFMKYHVPKCRFWVWFLEESLSFY